MRRIAAVLAVLALTGADAVAKSGEPLYGVIGERSALTLVELDPETLRRVPGRQRRLGSATSAAAIVRGRDLAYADGSRLRLIDLDTLKPFGSVRMAGMPQAIAWLEWRWVVVLMNQGTSVDLVVVDRSVMKIARRTTVPGSLVGLERTSAELVLLVAPEYGIGPARLVIADSRARIREVALDRVAAGTRWDALDPPRGESRSPGLAFDPARRTAYVVCADGVVAEVPLGGVPRYHAVRGSYAKVAVGSWRTAQWLGAGILAVTGTDSADGRNSHPSGLELIDTRSWSSRLVLRGASSALRWRDGVLATGATWEEGTGRGPGIGVVSVGRDGTERFRLLAAERIWLAAVTSTRAYVFMDGGNGAYVVDLSSARVAGRVSGSLPWLLPSQSMAVPED